MNLFENNKRVSKVRKSGIFRKLDCRVEELSSQPSVSLLIEMLDKVETSLVSLGKIGMAVAKLSNKSKYKSSNFHIIQGLPNLTNLVYLKKKKKKIKGSSPYDSFIYIRIHSGGHVG